MENTKKKMLALILGLTASMTLGACGGTTSSGSNSSGTDPISDTTDSSGGPASDTPISSGSDSTTTPPISSGTDSTPTPPISSGSDSTPTPPISSGSDSSGTSIDSGSPSVESPSTSTSTPAPTPTVKVGGVSRKKSFETYISNKGEKVNKKTEFFDRTQSYKVGTMNNFNVMPVVTFTLEGVPVTVDSWNYDIDIEVYNETEYQPIVNATSEYIDEIDTVNCDIDFSDLAQGHTFKITVTPDGLSASQLANIGAYQVSMEVDVLDGYNVYSALDLSYLYNDTSTKYSEPWAKFKEEKNIDQTISPTTFFFQDNIVVTKDSIPDAFFYKVGDPDVSASDSDYDRVIGTLRDKANIYIYKFQKDTSEETIKIVGNYFNLDSSQLPVVVRDSDQITTEGNVISHTTLLFGYCEKDYMDNKYYEMRDINFVGNSPRTEDVTKSGGLILSKMMSRAKWLNCIATSFFITFYDEKSTAPLLIEQCKAYDNFNSFIYSWGGEDLTINKCEMIGAGGPIIIQDHIYKGHETFPEQVPNTTIKESKLENYVAGSEGWFKVVGADGLIPGIKDLDGAFTPYGRTFLTPKAGTSGDNLVTMFNFICINKDGAAEGPTNSVIKGRLTIDDCPYFDYGTYDQNSSEALNTLITTVRASGAPVFQSSVADGIGYFGGEKVGLLGPNHTAISGTSPLFSGDYLALYYQGMMLAFGYGPTAAQ